MFGWCSLIIYRKHENAENWSDMGRGSYGPAPVLSGSGVTVKNIPTRENIPPVCFRVRSYAKLYPPNRRLVCGNVTFDSV